MQTLEALRAKLCGPRPDRARLLDIGCAIGCFTTAFARAGYEATGIDYSQVIVDRAEARFPDECSFLHMNAFEPVLDGTFDTVFCKGFSGYNTHDAAAVAEFINVYMKLLRPNGVFMLVYSSNFTGKEVGGEMANWVHRTVNSVVNSVHASDVLGPVFVRGNRFRLQGGPITVVRKLLGKRQTFCVLFKAS